ncbi:MAG: hypothetical protein RBT80_26860, partial [Candidatus Vecturithrix sp.]|nr:hypothetical protein [Candidatus Vecturithrix sp.]
MADTSRPKLEDANRKITSNRDYFENIGGNVYQYYSGIAPAGDPQALHEAYLNQLLETCNHLFLQGIDRKAASPEAACLHLSA